MHTDDGGGAGWRVVVTGSNGTSKSSRTARRRSSPSIASQPWGLAGGEPGAAGELATPLRRRGSGREVARQAHRPPMSSTLRGGSLPQRETGAEVQVAYDPNYTGEFVELVVGDPAVFVQLPRPILGAGLERRSRSSPTAPEAPACWLATCQRQRSGANSVLRTSWSSRTIGQRGRQARTTRPVPTPRGPDRGRWCPRAPSHRPCGPTGAAAIARPRCDS